MKRFGLAAIALIGLLAMTACQSTSQHVEHKEDLLAASGFKAVPANTPERQAMFKTLPPHKFLKEIKGDKIIYIYPDPTICACLYIGNSTAYSAYRKSMFDKKLADEQQMTANEISYVNDQWDWGPWGPAFGPGWPYTYYY